jgi:hypothetical protein
VSARRSGTGKRFSLLDFLKAGKSKRASAASGKVLSVLKVLLIICVFVGIVIGFIYLERYVARARDTHAKIADLELIGSPAWISPGLESRVTEAVRAHGEDLRIDEEAAESVYQNIVELVPWLEDVEIQTTHECIRVKGTWREPLAMLKIGGRQFYVDKEQVVLDYIPLPSLSLVEITGVGTTQTPRTGKAWERQDVGAALDILERLRMMDGAVTPQKPLLAEIASIDVSNFSGRKDSRKHHINLYARDSTEIMWGAEFGTSQRYMEVPEEEKIARLYGYYKENGSLQTGVKYINLCDPQESVPQPIDRYQQRAD